MTSSCPHQLPTASAVLPASGERKPLPIHTQIIPVTAHGFVCDEVITWDAMNAGSLPLEVLLPLIFTFLISVNCVSFLECPFLIGCLSLVGKVFNKSDFAATWWLPGLSSPHKNAVCSLVVTSVIGKASYCHLNCSCFTVEGFSVCHHKHLTWSKQSKGLEASEIFISSKCMVPSSSPGLAEVLVWLGLDDLGGFFQPCDSVAVYLKWGWFWFCSILINVTSEYHIGLSALKFCVDNIVLVSMWSFFSLNRAITLENQLVILGVSLTDAGGYYVQAVNEKNGENKTSPFIHLSVTREYPNCGDCAGTQRLHTGLTKAAQTKRALLAKDWTFKGEVSVSCLVWSTLNSKRGT